MLYNKIPGPFKRDPQTNRVVRGLFTSPALEDLYTAPIWTFTEKIDGMNMRAIWDGHEVTFGGRTDKAVIPGDLLAEMERIFTEEKFEQTFGENPVTVFGEGYGAGIQKGGGYREDKGFIGFDVAVNEKYLRREDARNVIEEAFGADFAQEITWAVTLQEAVEVVERGDLESAFPGIEEPEGVVGVTRSGLLDHRGNRIIVKVKGRDFRE